MLQQYVHTLLFTCPQCSGLVAATRASDHKNLEAVEQERFELTCFLCNREFESRGYLATKHSVEESAPRTQ